MKKLIYTLLSLLLFASCDRDDGAYSGQGSGELQITSSIATRASGTSWAEGDDIGVSMYAINTTSAYGAENTLYTTATSSGNFSSTTPLYFPAAADVDLLAYYPYVSEVDLGAYGLSVGGTQTESEIDLMKATATELQSTSEAVNLTFYHTMSKLQITLSDSETVSASDLVGGTMTLSGAVTEGSYNLHTDVITLSAATDDIEATISSEGGAEMILIPQTLSDALLTFETVAGVIYTTNLSATFASGDQTSYTASMSLMAANLSGAVISPWGEGNGTDGESLGAEQFYDIKLIDGVYNVYTATGLLEFADLVNSGSTSFDCTLMGDIDLGGIDSEGVGISGNEWTPIGSESSPYSGTFDGGGHIISGLYINTDSNYQGLFGYTGSDAEISNLGVSGSVSVGASSTSGWRCSGIVGYNKGTITNCYNAACVEGYAYIGGVAGVNAGTITNCYNTGSMSSYYRVGGVVGQNYSYGTLTNCYNIGSVSEVDYSGGVVGYNEGGTLTNCYNIGSVSEVDYSGGVVGLNAVTLTNCYYLESVTSDSYATPMSETDMQDESFVTTLNNNAATYNTSNTDKPQACAWVAVDSGYPTLDFDAKPTATN